MNTLKQWIAKQESFAASSELEPMHTWLVAPVSQHRESDCLAESNFAACLQALGGESETVQVLRFGHWAVGWTEWIVAAPEHEATLEALAERLDGYPVLDESDWSEREHAAAATVWRDCYRPHQRIAYIRKHRRDFEFY